MGGKMGGALKLFNISLNKLISILPANGLSPLYGIADPPPDPFLAVRESFPPAILTSDRNRRKRP